MKEKEYKVTDTGEFDEMYVEFFDCPNCKIMKCITPSYVYCPYCGAKLDWGDKNE